MKAIILIALAITLAAPIMSASELTNSDVMKMSSANLDESIILTAVANSESKFDVSAQGLIDLSAAKVSKAVVEAMIKKANAPAATPSLSNPPISSVIHPAAEPGNTMSPSEVMIIDGDKVPRPMRYLTPQIRAAARAFGFGGVATYAVLRGSAAEDRVNNSEPSFLISVPDQAQVDSYVTLASFAVRSNHTREVMTGGGYMSYSSGIHPDRVIAIAAEKLSDQSKAQKGFIIYKITPKKDLKPGEYAIILYTGEMQGLVGAWFTGAGNAFFDFGVEQ
ncbi:MAG TPA: hypothetical protein VGM64_02330 [Lacunisphaera sp.]|jgi:hypothetical protein